MLYLSVMLAISGISFIFSESSDGEKAEAVVIESNETKSIDETPNEIITQRNEIETKSPFDFHVNIFTDNEPQNTPIIFPSTPIPKTEPPDPLNAMFVELEKRKKFIVRICKRRLCYLKRKR